ncbi:unnamed protein product [Closterium sp. Yama58-4]|nr:unnamed protein product [Closterium sp. Yama58-4]
MLFALPLSRSRVSSLTRCTQDLNSRGPKRNIRFLKADRIEEFSVLGKTEEIASLRLPYVDLAVLHAKEDAAVRKAEGEAERIGVGVTAEAQDIFFALCKTLPCKWDRTKIIVMDEVQVPSPYRPENVTGGSPEANERVKKVLARERERLQLRLQQSA